MPLPERGGRPAGAEASAPRRSALASFSTALAAWAWKTGGLRIRDTGSAGRMTTLADMLNGRDGDRLSPWWTSLLYERHPAMTPSLHALFQLWRGETDSLPGRWRSLYNALIAALRPAEAVLRFLHWWWTVRRLLTPPPPSRSASGVRGITVAAYFPHCDPDEAARGHFRSRYWERLHDLLDVPPGEARPGGLTAGGVHWLLIRVRAPGQSLREQLALRDRFRAAAPAGISFHYAEEFLTPRAILRAWGRFLRMALASRRAEQPFRAACRLPLPEPPADAREAERGLHAAAPRRGQNFFHLVRGDYAASFRGWRGLERCLLDEAIRAFVRWTGPQRMTLYPQENCPWERMLVHAARQWPESGPIIGAQHSTVRPADFRYVDDPRTFTDDACRRFQPDVLALNGSHARAILLAAGIPPERLRDVEALRYQTAAQVCAPQANKPPHTPPRTSRSTLCLLTGYFAPEVRAHLRLLAEAHAAGLLDGWNILVKSHPWYDIRPAARAMLPHSLFRRLRFTSMPPSVLLSAAFCPSPALAWVSNSTSAAVDAVLAGCPLLVMGPARGFDMCPLSGLPGLSVSRTVRDVRHALAAPRRLLLPPGWLHTEPGLHRWRALLAEIPPR